MKPSQFFPDAAQCHDMQAASALDQRWLRGEPAKPAQKVISPEFIERLNAGMTLAQVAKKVLDGAWSGFPLVRNRAGAQRL